MKNFSESEYFLIKIFRKVHFAWMAFIIIIFYILIYIVTKNILGIEHPSSIEILRFYLGNSLFSIFAMWLSVKVYEQSVITIEDWINKNDILGSKDDIINKLNMAHNFFFGRFQFAIVGSIAGVIIRRLLIYFWRMQDATGNIIIDTITIFLILLLLLVSINALYCVYVVGLNGIKVKYPFEISNAYRGLASIARTNTIIVGLYLAFFGSAVVFWAYQYNTKIWSYFINILFLVGIIIVFYIVNSGIRHGIAMSKQAILFEIKNEMGEILPIYYSLIYSKNITPQSKFSLTMLFKVTLVLEFLSKRGKDVEGMNEWLFFPKFPLIFISIMSSMISIGRIIFDIRNKLS